RGMGYGPRFRAISEIWRRDGEALVSLGTPDGLEPDGRAPIHPALLDSCLQSLGAALSKDQSARGGLWVAAAARRAWLGAHAARVAFCHARLGGGAAADGVARGDLVLLDDGGEVLGTIEGVTLRHTTAASDAAETSVSDLFFAPRWRPKPRAEGS